MASVRTVVSRRYLRCVTFIVIGAIAWVGLTFLFTSAPTNDVLGRSDYPGIPDRNFMPINDNAKVELEDYLKAKFGNSCYQAKSRDDLTQRTLRNPKELGRRGCKQELPQALIIGMRQCGSDRIQRYLRFHPAVEVRTDIPIDYSDIYEKGFDWYKEQMPYTTEAQVTLDKLPNYFIFPEDAPKRVKYGISPATKLIAVVCDPVRRAVAEYARLSAKREERLEDVQSHIKKTFEKSVFDSKHQDNVAHLNLLIDNSIYFKHLLSWMRYFPPAQIYVVDGKHLKFNTFTEFRRLEEFLGLPNFYQESHFSFDDNIQAYCLSFPQNVCPRVAADFIPRPRVDDDIKQRLYEFFEPYDRTLGEYFKQNFTWREKLQNMANEQGQGEEVQDTLNQLVDDEETVAGTDDDGGREVIINQLLAQNMQNENGDIIELQELEDFELAETGSESSQSDIESSFEEPSESDDLQKNLNLLEDKYPGGILPETDNLKNLPNANGNTDAKMLAV
uniref:Heparan sulfate glucosamine 3-O-sulfotransferase 2-like n=1 Tax=Saccoglossus kowalevskii TaxID=10224 RepID=A0ABM0MMN9_SACKO|nr:PREDICTED: heparan sulfate glucosamine 3-O-sulfotransferase 2-like [Saccoglossus kowalevskii]